MRLGMSNYLIISIIVIVINYIPYLKYDNKIVLLYY